MTGGPDYPGKNRWSITALTAPLLLRYGYFDRRGR